MKVIARNQRQILNELLSLFNLALNLRLYDCEVKYSSLYTFGPNFVSSFDAGYLSVIIYLLLHNFDFSSNFVRN